MTVLVLLLEVVFWWGKDWDHGSFLNIHSPAPVLFRA